MKFDSDWPNGFWGEDVWRVWTTYLPHKLTNEKSSKEGGVAPAKTKVIKGQSHEQSSSIDAHNLKNLHAKFEDCTRISYGL